jgi:hypothetical protein
VPVKRAGDRRVPSQCRTSLNTPLPPSSSPMWDAAVFPRSRRVYGRGPASAAVKAGLSTLTKRSVGVPAGQPRVVVSDCGSPASRGATLNQGVRRCDSCKLCFRFIAQSSQSTGGNLKAVLKDSKNECPLNLHCTCCAAVDYCL